MKCAARFIFNMQLGLVTLLSCAMLMSCGVDSADFNSVPGSSEETLGEVQQKVVYNGHDYLFVVSRRTWIQAAESCASLGYGLATINNSAEDEWLKSNLTSTETWWIGYNDRSAEGSWRWSNGTSAYVNWSPGEPNNWGGNEDCAVKISSGTYVGLWNDEDCGKQFAYVCESVDSSAGLKYFDYSGSNTGSATQNTVDVVVTLQAGQTLTIGTCGVVGASASGDTYLRLYGPTGQQVTYNDDACSSLSSNFSYVVPAGSGGTYVIKAGCYSSGSCSGRVGYTIDTVFGRFARYCGKVNSHQSPGGNWAPDPDCTSGCNIGGLSYCKKFWPSSTSIRQINVSSKPNNAWTNAGCGPVVDDWDGNDEFECVGESLRPPATCYDAGWNLVNCYSDCGVARCYDQSWNSVSCINGSTQACPVYCYDANGGALDCATDCGAAECRNGLGSIVPCPHEIAYCGAGPAVCCDETGCHDEAEDCNGSDEPWPSDEPPPCEPLIMSCATPEDDPEDQAGWAAPDVEETAYTAAGILPNVNPTTCACASSDGRTTSCTYEIRFVKFVPRSAPSLDKRADIEHITFNMGNGDVRFTGKDWLAPDPGIPVDYEIIVGRSIGTTSVPCGSTVNLPIRLSGQERDPAKYDDRGEMTVTLPISCPRARSTESTHLIELRNKRGHLKHTWDITLEVVLANSCTASGGAPSCPVPPGTPRAPCEYEFESVSLHHRDAPTFDKKGNFQGWIGEYDFPPVRFVPDSNGGSFKQGNIEIKRGKSKDIPTLSFGKTLVACNSSVTVDGKMGVLELDGIPGKNDYGTANARTTFTCPPTKEEWTYQNTELLLYGNASSPRHVVDLKSRYGVQNRNYCRFEPEGGLITPCSFQIDLLSVKKIFGSIGNYQLNFLVNNTQATFTPWIWGDGNSWEPADDDRSAHVASVKVPCGQATEVEMAVQGEEKDSTIFRTPFEYGGARLNIPLSCGQGFTSRTMTFPMEFRNRRGKVKDKIEVTIQVSNPGFEKECKCVTEKCGDGICTGYEKGSCPADCGSPTAFVVGRFARYCGRLNIHGSPERGWFPDSTDCNAGCNVGGLDYCKKYWPESTGIRRVPVSPKANDVWKSTSIKGCGPYVLDDHDGDDEFECLR